MPKNKHEKLDVRKWPFFAEDAEVSDFGIKRLNALPQIVLEDMRKMILEAMDQTERIAADVLHGSPPQGVKEWIESHRS